jgi:hypothetical protein
MCKYYKTCGNWENSKLCENTPPFGRRVSTQFLIFPISTRVDTTVYQHGKCFIFVNYKILNCYYRIHLWKRGEGLLHACISSLEQKSFALVCFVLRRKDRTI